MKKIVLTLVFLSTTLGLWAQGMKFEHGSWKEVLALAKESKKPIFVDIYTTWCGPCKTMSNEIFPQKTVGDHFNANFINYKIDAEKGEGIELAKQFAVEAYPTYLYVNGNGELIYRAVGSKPAEDFIEESKKALSAANSTENLAYFKSNYEAKKNDVEFLKKYLNKLNDISLDPSEILEQYLEVLPQDQKVSQDVFTLIQGGSSDKVKFGSKILNHYLTNKDKFDQLDAKNSYIAQSIFYNAAYRATMLAAKKKDETTFNEVVAALDKYYKGEQKEDFQEAYYKTSGNTEKYMALVTNRLDKIVAEGIAGAEKKNQEFLEKNIEKLKQSEGNDGNVDAKVDQFKTKYGKYIFRMRSMQLNEESWSIAEKYQTDKNKLNKALGWAKFALELTPEDYNTMDTYACLQYLSGKKKEAVKTIEKAMSLVKDNPESLKEFQNRLAVMKAGKELSLN